MHLLGFFASALTGALVGWVAALVLSRLAGEPPHAGPTRLGWGALGLGIAAAGALALGFRSGALFGPLASGPVIPGQLVRDPLAWSAGLSVAGLFLAFMAAGRVGDRLWPTGLGLLLAGGVLLLWIVLWLSRLGDLLFAH